MQYTTHYNLNLPEGTDIVNPLVQDNPNYSAIDAAMFANKQAVIGTASEVVSGTVHAITRSNPDSDYFKFTATGNWTVGDSMSVDGTTVSVYLSDGTTPATGAYIINTEVLALLSGTRVTLIVSAGVEVASDVAYDNTGSGLTATNVQDAIDELAGVKVIATAAANQTYSTQLTSLFAAYSALTTDDKLRSSLVVNNDNKARIISTYGIYTLFAVGATDVEAISYNIQNGTTRQLIGSTVNILTNTINPSDIKLIID